MTLTTGGATKTLVTNYYDAAGYNGQPAASPCNAESLSAPAGREFSATGNSPYLGLVTQTVNPAKAVCIHYYAMGNMADATDSTGATVTATSTSSTNYAAPSTVTTESHNESIGYNAWLGISQTTGANGEQAGMSYDNYGRPASVVTADTYPNIAYGYDYSAAGVLPAWQRKSPSANTNDGVQKTLLDGVGHPVEVQSGDNSGVKGNVDSVYAPCACSPLGKLQKTSMPYAPGGTPVWTTYTYDGMGRTLSMQQPDGASTTTYAYSGNVTTVTDPAGHWKKFTSDVEGNLVTVVEPDPVTPATATLTTTYAYDWMKNLTSSTMTRGGTTQTRTFVYNDLGQLTSSTIPESGTTTYTYGTNGKVASRLDAKGQYTTYVYSSSPSVLTGVHQFPNGVNGAEDLCQAVTYTYGSDPSVYAYHRLQLVNFGTLGQSCAGGTDPTSYGYSYQYNIAGRPTYKYLLFNRMYLGQAIGGYVAEDVSYNASGRVTNKYYYGPDPFGTSPINGGWMSLNYSYDSMGRPAGVADGGYGNNPVWVKNVQYDAAGRMTSLQRMEALSSPASYVTETMGYNVNGQLTSFNWAQGTANSSVPSGGVSYAYSATQNNGQIVQAVDTVSGETISYQYDALKRLVLASGTPNAGSTPAAWTQTYGYDGFGNLTSKALNNGTPTTIAVNAATNRLTNASYDANGNMTSGAGAALSYDEGNRLVSATPVSGGTEYYGYDPGNKRIYRKRADGVEEWSFYGTDGEKLSTVNFYLNCGDYGDPSTCGFLTYTISTNVWFAGKLIWSRTGSGNTSGPVYADRLGTNRMGGARFYPYGDEIGSTGNDRVKFATYTRDGFTGLDYADQRYYASSYGRFNTADPYRASAGPKNPDTWNRYAYVAGDPANANDPQGLCIKADGNLYDGADEQFFRNEGYVEADYGDGPCGSNSWVGGSAAGNNSTTANATIEPFTLSGLWSAFVEYIQQYPITGSVTVPTPETAGMFGVQLNGAILPQSNLLCAQLSLTLGLPGTQGGVSFGTLLTTDPGAVISSFTGWGAGVSLTPPGIGLAGGNGLGVQYGNTGLWGPTLTTKGSGVSGGYGACWQTGTWNPVTSPADLVAPLASRTNSVSAPPPTRQEPRR